MQNPSMKDTAARAPRFYVDAALRAGGACVLPEDAAHHAVHVLRVRAGDAITLFDGRGGEFAAPVAATGRRRIPAAGPGDRPPGAGWPLQGGLVQGVSSGRRMDFTW